METQANLVAYINKMGIKQTAISAATGIEKSAVSRSMSLERKLSVDEYAAICSFLGKSMDDFRGQK